MRIPKDWKPHIANGRMLIVSPFTNKQNRPTQETVRIRNQLVASLSRQILVAYAEPGGKTEAFTADLLKQGKAVSTFESEHTTNLREMGATILYIEGL